MISIDSWQPKTADVDLLRRCAKAIRQVVPDADVILYGSRARGDANEYSDYDILILVNGPTDMTLEAHFLDRLFPLEVESGAVLTFMTYSRQQWDTPLYRAMPFHENIDRDGVLI
jgi:predicted nucleotidyltransferase